MKRATLHVFEAAEFAVAFSVYRFLRHHSINATLVTKHAVQVAPDQAQNASRLLPTWKWGWDRPTTYVERGENRQ